MGQARLGWVEGGRGLAALAVAFLHGTHMMAPVQYSGHAGFGDVFRFGFLGVDFFFVLSGFIIFHVNRHELGRPAALSTYVTRRAVRIFPTYWFVFVVVLAANLAFQKNKASVSVDWLAAQVSLLDPAIPWLGPAWTLQHELLFYLIFSSFFIHLRFGLAVLGLWAIAVAVNAATGMVELTGIPQTWTAKLLHPYAMHFMLGMALAALFGHSRLLWAATLGLAAVGGLTSWKLFADGLSWNSVVLLRYFSAATLFGAALGGLLLLEKTRARAPRFLLWLGAISYSLYLIHLYPMGYFYAVLARLGWYKRLPDELIFVLALALAMGLAHVLNRYFESPVIGWGRRLQPKASNDPIVRRA